MSYAVYQTVWYQGGEWIVSMVDYQQQTVTLARQKKKEFPPLFRKDNWMDSTFETLDVTIEKLEAEHKFFESERDRLEDQARRTAEKFAFGFDRNMRVATFQTDDKASEAFRNMQQAIEALIGSGFMSMTESEIRKLVGLDADNSEKADRREVMDKKYEAPSCDGYAVLWSRYSTVQDASSLVIGDIDLDNQKMYKLERVDSLDDAWAFVDYLNDDEAGHACCIREDAVVLFVQEGSGWEAMTDEEVPNEFQ